MSLAVNKDPYHGHYPDPDDTVSKLTWTMLLAMGLPLTPWYAMRTRLWKYYSNQAERIIYHREHERLHGRRTTARTGNDPVISLHSTHPCGLCRR